MKANELMNAWIENSKAAMGPARELSEITQRSFSRLSEHNMNLTKEYMDMSARSLQVLTSIRDPRALVTEQVNLAKELGDKMMSSAEQYTKLATEAQGELVAWMEKSAEDAVTKVSEAAEKAA
jgi:phasin family protein